MKMKNAIKWILGAVALVLVCVLVYTVSGKTQNSENNEEEVAVAAEASSEEAAIKSLVLSNLDDLEIGMRKQDTGIFAKVELSEGATLTEEDVVFVSTNPDVAEVTFDRITRANSVYCVILGVAPGETEIYAVTKDGSLETPHKKVIVTENTVTE
ncbi:MULTISPECIES: hypothetical protein [unclassified Butyrivibrio]|uniref:hypothetical protein n=1 Tax=unclassified Butyrivibrio TaxID=2639466 RepID=UPI0003B4190C|nr:MULTISPECIES: hypothetical protein [unclassified Butyrivibrio]MDC7292126.1 hypothetical protein [Butyrivibrio sp. DSM 10294]